MSNFIAGVIGTRGQELLAEQLTKLISKEVCEGIRKAFQGPLTKKYEDFLNSAAEDLGKEFFIKKLTEVMGKLEVNKVTITGGGSGPGLFGGGDGVEKGESKDDSTEVPGNPVEGKLPTNINTGSSGIMGAASGIMGNLSGTASSVSDMVKSTTAGLAPDEGVVPGYLSTALTEDSVKQMLKDGMDKLATYMGSDGKDELVKMFIGVLKKQINNIYEGDGNEAFKEVITNIIQEKCKKEETLDENGENVGDEEENGGEGEEVEGEENGGASSGGKSKKINRTTRKKKNKKH